MAEPVDLLDSVLGKTADAIDGVRPEQLPQPTPCPEYDVAGMVDHLVTWMGTFSDAAAGGAATGQSGTADEPATRFRAAADRAVRALREGGPELMAKMPNGELPASALTGMMLMEYVGHGWDLATATGQPVRYSDDEAEAAMAAGRGMLKPEYRGAGKAFADEVDPPPDATGVERLIAFLGRDPRWRPPGG